MIEVKAAGKKGRGIFATQSISKGSVIEKSPYIFIPSKDFEELMVTVIRYYWFYVRDNKRDNPSCAIGLGYTSLYNHSKTPNAEWRIFPRSKTIKITALRNIRKGQEITINYGYDVK